MVNISKQLAERSRVYCCYGGALFGITRYWWHCSWKLVLTSSVLVGRAIAFLGDCALAQVTPDGTLPNNSIVTPQGNTSVISGGTQAGSNLFHSFEEFSVPTGGAAYFNNALNIQNIFSRVTGGSISNIDGLLRANGTANLFVINPNGIIFGSNATLDIGGSFLASTASSLNFADGSQFSATAPQATPLLGVSVPLGLQYGGTAGSILNQYQVVNSNDQPVGLGVLPGKTLALVGGDVRLNGGSLNAPGGRVELGGLAGPGTVGLNVDSNNLLLSFPDNVARANVYLANPKSNPARVNVAERNGGSIAITARNIDISGGSELRGGIETNLGFPDSMAGDIELRATEEIAIANGFINNVLETGAVGKGGNITITAGSLSVTDGARVNASILGRGDAGNVTINVRDTVSFDGVGSNEESSGAYSRVERKASGKSGNINITAGSLSVTDGAQVNASTLGRGDAGNVTINVRDTAFFKGVSTSLGSNENYSWAASRVERRASGKSGNITITAGSLSVTDGAQVTAATAGKGDAGSVTIIARDTVSFDGVGSKKGNPSAIFSAVAPDGGVGNSGNINITARVLSVTNGARLSTSAVRNKNASENTGQAGNLTITTEQLIVQNNAEINVRSDRSGNAGELRVKAGYIFLNNRGRLRAATTVSQGGNIDLQVRDLILMRRQSLISARGGRTGNGGNVRINTPLLVAFPTENSDIIANADAGRGGNINITAQGIFGIEFREQQTPENDINASSQFGVDGVVEINTPDVDPSQGLVELPVELVDTSRQIASSCGAGGENEFIVTGRGGLPPSPTDTLSSDTVWSDLRSPTQRAQTQPNFDEATNLTTSEPAPIVEATGWVINNKGEVVLTATAPNATPRIPWLPSVNCHAPQNSS